MGAFFGVVGLLIERVFPANWSRRWLWCAVIAISIFMPGYSRVHNNSSVMAAFDHNSAVVTWMDPAWFLRAESLNGWIQRIWLTATILLLAWGVSHIVRVALLLRSSRKTAKDNDAIVDGVPVVVTDSLGPATVGLVRSRVVLPRWVLALPGVQRQYVVRHEAEHSRAHDAHLLLFMSLGLLLAPWDLALWWQLRRLRLAVEMDCDNRVVSALGDPQAYGELLFKVAEASSRGPQLQPAFLGAGLLEQRLTALLQPSQLRRFQKLLLPALAIALLILTLRMPHPILGHSTRTHAAMTATR
jgi:beta-lactamase regulating signal transducer with metallopeptidase domain